MKFDKFFANKEYAILFNTENGFEIIQGIAGNPDPFSLKLPSLLDVGIMGHCINKCSFCYQGHIKQDNMKLGDFKKIIDSVKHHTNQVALGGRGDPNHHEHFAEIVEYARKNGVVPNYTTSGIGLTDDQIEVSKMCGAVAVSQIFSEQKIKIRVRRKKDLYDEQGVEWEVCSSNDNNENYEYKEIEITELKTDDFTFDAIQKFISNGIKTNIHFIYSKHSHDLAIDIINGKDVWNGKVDLKKLNAVIFLLFKPAGAGSELKWSPSKAQLHSFSNIVFNPKCKFKIGMDSCLINHVLQYFEPNKLQRMSIDSCEGARMSAYITPDMRMMPCSFADKRDWSIPIDDIKDINWIWNESKTFNKFREILKQKQCSCPLKL